MRGREAKRQCQPRQPPAVQQSWQAAALGTTGPACGAAAGAAVGACAGRWRVRGALCCRSAVLRGQQPLFLGIRGVGCVRGVGDGGG